MDSGGNYYALNLKNLGISEDSLKLVLLLNKNKTSTGMTKISPKIRNR
jgi:hypothetical protein